MEPTIFTLDDLGTPHTEALGWQWAYGCFETFLWENDRIVGLEWHAERLLFGCKNLGLGPTFPPEEAPARILAALQGYSGTTCRVRIEAVLDDAGFLGAGKPPFAMRVGGRLARWEKAAESTEFSLKVLTDPRQELLQPSPGYKPLDYAARMAMRNELLRRGVDEGLVARPDGIVIGGLVSNLFVSMDGENWKTPTLSSGCLPGVTRQILLNEVEEISASAAEIRREDLREATSVFVSNSVVGVQPVHRFFYGDRSWKNLDPAPAEAVREIYSSAFV
jgi:branched-chain amino acid aminotransferase